MSNYTRKYSPIRIYNATLYNQTTNRNETLTVQARNKAQAYVIVGAKLHINYGSAVFYIRLIKLKFDREASAAIK